MKDLSGQFMALGPIAGVRARAWATGDVEPVGRLLGEEWYPEFERRHALLTGIDQLLFNLSQASGAVVAERDDGTFLGVCLANWGAPDAADLATWQDMMAGLRAEAAGWGLVLRPEPSVETEGHGLLERVARERGSDGVGELELLFVSADARGLGLGRRLMETGLAYLRECGATRYRLVTDDACGWGLYEHLGLERVGERVSTSANDPGLRLYVYEGAL
ncbi:MAG: GNAT family N-acetyltransferase [Atopobiaceae bacterium]|nr:GNAT family N-acetyltransferase [Atopobiaceae bacterium]